MCVPISKLPQVLLETNEDFNKSSIVGKFTHMHTCTWIKIFYLHSAPTVGHVGDGNFHCLLLVDPKNEQELTEAQELSVRMARYCHMY